jgi:DNA-binding transcriptional ArsR family regulator
MQLYQPLARIVKALAHPVRLCILDMLRQEKIIVNVPGKGPATVWGLMR